jgi:hypothetical protein
MDARGLSDEQLIELKRPSLAAAHVRSHAHAPKAPSTLTTSSLHTGQPMANIDRR